MKHVFIVNPAAGSHDVTDDVRTALERCAPDIDYEIYRTAAKGDAKKYMETCTDGTYRFYACGGDGTLNEVVSGAVGRENISVSAYPCGSGNDFIKYYGSKDDFLDIESLVNGEDKEIDVIKVGDRYAVNAVHFGFDCTVLKTMRRVRRNKILGGRRAYATGVVAALLQSMKTKCRVSVDGKSIGSGEILLCTVSNGRYVGGKYMCAPRSRNDDGLIEVCLVNPVSRLTFLRLSKEYEKGNHLDDPRFQGKINYARGKTVEIEGGEDFCVSLDGELTEGRYFKAEILEKAVRFAVPQRILLREKEYVH